MPDQNIPKGILSVSQISFKILWRNLMPGDEKNFKPKFPSKLKILYRGKWVSWCMHFQYNKMIV